MHVGRDVLHMRVLELLSKKDTLSGKGKDEVSDSLSHSLAISTKGLCYNAFLLFVVRRQIMVSEH